MISIEFQLALGLAERIIEQTQFNLAKLAKIETKGREIFQVRFDAQAYFDASGAMK